MLKIAIIGDLVPTSLSHRATNQAFSILQKARPDLRSEWIATECCSTQSLERYHGVLVNTGTYSVPENVIKCLTWLRKSGKVTLATCNGFQHMLLEFALNELGIKNAGHAEYSPDSPEHFITPLSCSLAGKRLEVSLEPDSQVGRLCSTQLLKEKFFCSYGADARYTNRLEKSDLKIVGRDADNIIRVTELPEHPFYVGTLFVPQANCTPRNPHPILKGFLEAAHNEKS